MSTFEERLKELKDLVKRGELFYKYSITKRAFAYIVVCGIATSRFKTFDWCYDDAIKDGLPRAVTHAFDYFDIISNKEKIQSYRQQGSLNIFLPEQLSNYPNDIIALMDLFELVMHNKYIPDINRKLPHGLIKELNELVLAVVGVLKSSDKEKEELSNELDSLLKDAGCI